MSDEKLTLNQDEKDPKIFEINSPAKVIRQHCLDCCSNQSNEITMCTSYDCPLYPFRYTNKKTFENYTGEIYTRVKAIKAYCLDCSGYDRTESINCAHKNCPLHPYRRGTNPRRTRKNKDIFEENEDILEETEAN